MEVAAEALRLRSEAERRPLRLPVNRRIDDAHRAQTPDGLTVTFTIQVSPHSRVLEAVFERADRAPSDDECEAWLLALLPDRTPVEAPNIPGARTRRFEVFER